MYHHPIQPQPNIGQREHGQITSLVIQTDNLIADCFAQVTRLNLCHERLVSPRPAPVPTATTERVERTDSVEARLQEVNRSLDGLRERLTMIASEFEKSV